MQYIQELHHHQGTLTLSTAQKLFNNKTAIFNSLTQLIPRSFPSAADLQGPSIASVLKQAINSGIVSGALDGMEGLEEVHKRGFLQAELQDEHEEEIVYEFPSLLHAR